MFSSNPYVHCIQTFAGVTATVTGWGTTSSGGSLSATLKEVNVGVLSNRACKYVLSTSEQDPEFGCRMSCKIFILPGMTTATPAAGSPPTWCAPWWLGAARTLVRVTQVSSYYPMSPGLSSVVCRRPAGDSKRRKRCDSRTKLCSNR